MYKVHVEIGQFQFVEFETETVEDAVLRYSEIKQAFSDGGGLPPDEWRKALDQYINTGEMDSTKYLSMSKPQQMVIQEIKKHVKRMEYKKENNE